MRRIHTLVLVVVLLLVSSVRPVAAPNREHQQMMADIRMLQEQNQQLQMLLGSLTETLKTVTSRLDEQAGITRKAFADSKLLVDTVAGDVRILREKLDETNVRIGSLAQEVEALRLAIPPTPAGLPTPDVPPDPSTDPAAVPAAPAAPGASLGTTPQRLFQQAWTDYTAGQFDLAIVEFELFLKTFPKSEQADDAYFYIGESRYLSSRYAEAVAAYDQVIAIAPTGDFAADAYYKRGLAHERLGARDQARESYETVMKNFPDHRAATLAKQAHERLSKSAR